MVTFHFCGADGLDREYSTELTTSGDMRIWFGNVLLQNSNRKLKAAAAITLQQPIAQVANCEVLDLADFR